MILIGTEADTTPLYTYVRGDFRLAIVHVFDSSPGDSRAARRCIVAPTALRSRFGRRGLRVSPRRSSCHEESVSSCNDCGGVSETEGIDRQRARVNRAGHRSKEVVTEPADISGPVTSILEDIIRA